ncbi:MAG: DHH family phosphoesterase [Fervidicoccaceae archaeon]
MRQKNYWRCSQINSVLEKELKDLATRNRNLVILTHKSADLDAIASSIALKSFFKMNGLKSSEEILLFFPMGISSDASNSLEKCQVNLNEENYRIEMEASLLKSSSIIIVDTASESQLPKEVVEAIMKNEDTFLIDHHSSNTLKQLVNSYYWDSISTSTSEIVAQILPTNAWNHKTLVLLLMGILADTSRFFRATSKTFELAGKISSLIDYERVRNCMGKGIEDRSLRIARLKALQRTTLADLDHLIISMTFVSSYEKEVADLLLRIGSDVSIVVSPKKEETRIILKFRSSLDDISKELIASVVEDIVKTRRAGHRDFLIFALEKGLSKNEAQKLISEIRKSLSKRASEKSH